MLFLWIFSVFWCAISFTMATLVWQSPEPPYVRAFISIFVLIGVGLLVFLIKSQYDRRRVGKATLVVRPVAAVAGDTLTFGFQVDRDDHAGQPVKFELLGQVDDDGWATRQTITKTSVIKPALRRATAHLKLPDNATASGSSWRWHATAALEKYPLAKATQDITVSAGPLTEAPSSDAFVIDPAGAGVPPPGAHEITTGVWRWRSRSHRIQGIGLALLAFAAFWLWNTAGFALPPRGSDDGTAAQLIGAALVLFSLPFWIGGVVLAGLGLVMLTFSQTATARTGEVELVVNALGMTLSTDTLSASDITLMQATASMSSGPNVMRYGLAARTESGVVDLPFSARTTDDLTMQASWLVDVLAVSAVRFDPQVMGADLRKRTRAKDDQTRHRIGRWIKLAMGISGALAVIAFVTIFAGFVGG